MTQENEQVEQVAEQVSPVLADEGIGLSLEEVKALLSQKHDMVIGTDDPILMMVTLHNAFLAEHQKLFHRHESALQKLMGAETGKYLQALTSLTNKLDGVSELALTKSANLHLEKLGSLKRDIFWLAVIVGGGALLNLTALCASRFF